MISKKKKQKNFQILGSCLPETERKMLLSPLTFPNASSSSSLSSLPLTLSPFLLHIVIKPGLARRVDPGPGGWTGLGLLKDRLVQQPGKTRSTWWVDL